MKKEKTLLYNTILDWLKKKQESTLWSNTKYLLSCLLLLFINCVGLSNTIQVPKNGDPTLIGKSVSVYFDNSGNKTLDEIISLNDEFEQNNLDIVNAQVTSSTVWLKFIIENSTSLEELLLQVMTCNADEITLYKLTEEGLHKEGPYGQTLPFKERNFDHPHFIFQLRLPPSKRATYFLSIKNKDQTTFALQIGSQKSILEGIFDYDISNGIYLGIFLVMFIYNVFLYFNTKNKYYLSYSAFVLAFGIGLFTMAGYSFKYFWPASPWLEQRSIVLVSAIIPISALIFANSFLNLKTNLPKTSKLILSFVITYGIVFLIALAGYIQLGQKLILALFISVFLIFGIALKLSLSGHRKAKFYLAAWSVYLFGIIVFVLKDFGLVPYNVITNRMMHFGSVLEVILLSFALGDYINILRKEKEESQKKVLKGLQRNEQIIKSQNKMLEKKVKERTLKLETTNLDLSQAMNELKDTQTQLVDAEKMASLGQLTAGIAHEINNPINFVSSNISPLKKDIDDLREIIARYETATTEEGISAAQTKLIRELKEEIDLDFTLVEIDELLHGIKDGADRTAEIVKGLKNFSRLDESLIKAADINEGIKSTLLILKSKFSSIKLVEDYGDLVPIHCLPGKLNQLFMNILDNAIYACTKKEYPAESTARITIVTNQSKTSTTIQIKDNGIGMDNQTKTKIFEPFFTTKEVGEGTGLGMSIVHGIITNHSGDIKIKTEIGIGTEITINLPRVTNNS
jgi:signal transduction histidine kinase